MVKAAPGADRDVAEEVEDAAAIRELGKPVKHLRSPFFRLRALPHFAQGVNDQTDFRALGAFDQKDVPRVDQTARPGRKLRAVSTHSPRWPRGRAACSALILGPTQWIMTAASPGCRAMASCKCGLGRAKLQHVTQDRDPAAAADPADAIFVGLAAIRTSSACSHRGRVGVEGIVDQIEEGFLDDIQKDPFALTPPGRGDCQRPRSCAAIIGSAPRASATAKAPSAFRRAKWRPGVETL